MNESDLPNIVSILDKIENACIQKPHVYHDILCNLILQKKVEKSASNSQVNENIAELNQWITEDNFPAIKALFYKALHQSWLKTNDSMITPCDHRSTSVASILAWAHEIKLSRKNIAIVCCSLDKMNEKRLTALWEAIVYSEVTSIQGLSNFDDQTPEEWQISCNGIAKSYLSSYRFERTTYITAKVTTEMWQEFWNAIKKSPVTSLDLRFVQFINHHAFNQLWNILCVGLTESKIKWLSLERMNLMKLALEHWQTLYNALRVIQIESLNLTCNHLYGLADNNMANAMESLGRWEIVCDIIKLPSLKQLIFREDNFERLLPAAWTKLCQTFNSSHLEKLDIGISSDSQLSENQWLEFLSELSNSPLLSLVLKHCSTRELTAKVIESIVKLIENEKNLLQPLDISQHYGELVLNKEQWERLGDAYRKKGIKAWSVERINTTEEHLSWFFEGVHISGVESLHFCSSNFNSLTPQLWEKMATWVKKANISTVAISKDYSFESDIEKWQCFCNFIVNSNIKTLIFDTQPSRNLTTDQIQHLGDAIKISQLESLTMIFPEFRMSLNNLTILLAAIKESHIAHLKLPYENAITLSKEKRDILNDAMKCVEPRARIKMPLTSLCKQTLFGKYNAKLTNDSITYQYGNTVEKTELGEALVSALFSRP